MGKSDKVGFRLEHGIDIDLDEGWKKITERQFGGTPARGFNELVQNFIDSYPSGTSWEDRIARIGIDGNSISITDWGEGMSLNRLELLTRLGGTDKGLDGTKIGQFGIGFFSIFNSALGTRRVIVTTRCEDHVVRLTFTVQQQGKRPDIQTEILEENTDFSTRIKVVFDRPYSPKACLVAAKKALTYYPCKVLINGKPHKSVWELGRQRQAFRFEESECDGMIERGGGFHGPMVTMLCKYEKLLQVPLGSLNSGGHNYRCDLRDFKGRDMLYLPNLSITLNANDLSVTISRDGFYLDNAYQQSLAIMSKALLRFANQRARDCFNGNEALIVANHYTLASRIKTFLAAGDPYREAETEEDTLVQALAAAPIYSLSGKRSKRSLRDIFVDRTKELPVFYAPNGNNLRWLGGAFKRDFIVLPPKTAEGGGAPDLHDTIFQTIFDDVVNLDKIRNDRDKIRELVEHEIISEEALKPEVQVVGALALTEDEQGLLDEVNELLGVLPVRKAIEKNLFLHPRKITAAYFSVKEKEMAVSTGLLDENGKVVDNAPDDDRKRDIRIGLCLDHPLIKHLVKARDPFRAFYASTFLAHELAKCQDLLVPYSRYFHVVKSNLAADMRKGLIASLLPDNSETVE